MYTGRVRVYRCTYASGGFMLTPQLSLEDGMLLIFTPLCQILLGIEGSIKP